MKVYLVIWSYYDDWTIHGVFKSKEKAEKYVHDEIDYEINQFKIFEYTVIE